MLNDYCDKKLKGMKNNNEVKNLFECQFILGTDLVNLINQVEMESSGKIQISSEINVGKIHLGGGGPSRP